MFVVHQEEIRMSSNLFARLLYAGMVAAASGRSQIVEVPPLTAPAHFDRLRASRSAASVGAERRQFASRAEEIIMSGGARLPLNADGSRVIGSVHSVITNSAAGAWDIAIDGSHAWRLQLRKPGASM